MSRVKVLAVIITLILGAGAVLAQDGLPAIDDAKVDCIARVPFPMLQPLVTPSEQVAAVKVYFRDVNAADFYWVQATSTVDGYEAVLPVPSEGTESIVYYVEAITEAGEVVETAQYTAKVVEKESDCDDKVAATYPGEDPNLLIGSTNPNAAAYPPGFDTGGVIGTVGTGGEIAAGRGVSPLLIGGITVGTLAGGIILLDDDNNDRNVSPSMP